MGILKRDIQIMKMKFAYALGAFGLLGFAACQTAPAPEPEAELEVVEEIVIVEEMAPEAEPAEPAMEETAPMEEAVMSKCPATETRDWSAWVNTFPGPDAKPMLHVAGQVKLPKPGYTESWTVGMADRSAVPMQQLILELSEPEGMVAQVETWRQVSFATPAIAETYKSVVIKCGGDLLIEITEIMDVQ